MIKLSGCPNQGLVETRLARVAGRRKKPDKIVFVGKDANMDRRFQVSRGTAPKVLLAAPAQPSNKAARGRAL